MMSSINFPPIQHIEIRDGQARIAGRNLKIKMIISRLLHGQGATIEEVMDQYSLTQAQVYATLTYYYDHQQAIDDYFEQEDADAKANITPLSVLKARVSQS